MVGIWPTKTTDLGVEAARRQPHGDREYDDLVEATGADMSMSARGAAGSPRFQTSPAVQVEADRFVVPLVHARLCEPTVTRGFYAGLGAAVVLGVVDLPVAVLVGVGVAIARHRRT